MGHDGKPAATFDLAIRVESHVVTIATERIRELNGCELQEFRFPPEPWIRVTGDMPGAKVCVKMYTRENIEANAGAKWY